MMICQFNDVKIKRAILVLSLLTSLFFLLPTPAEATQSVTFGWDPSIDAGIAGYNIYYGTASHVYTNKVSVANTTVTVSNLLEGVTYYFAATTYDVLGQESVFSDEIPYDVPVIVAHQPPAFGNLPAMATATVGQKLAIAAAASGQAPLSYNLGPGMPAGTWINPTNGLFIWNPQISQAGTTNAITLIVTDSGSPPLSSTQAFTVIVQDYIHCCLRSSIMAANSNGSMALSVYASSPVTNLQFTLSYPPDLLTNLIISCTNPLVGAAFATLIAPGQVHVTVGTSAGQSISGSQTLGSIGFQPMDNQKTVVTSVKTDKPMALKTDGTIANYTEAAQGRLTIVGQSSLVEALMAGGVRSLAVYGPLGASYQVETCNALGNMGSWVAAMSPFTMTNLSQTFQLAPDLNAATFYRTRKL